MTKVLPQDYPVTRRDTDTGAYKVIPGILTAFYRQAVKWDPGCVASKKAPRISSGESGERFASEEFARKYAFHDGMLMEHAIARYIDWAATVVGLRISALHNVDVRNLFPVPPRTKLKVGPPGDTKLYNNTLNDWVVVMYFQTADKNEDINFRLNHLTYYRDPIAIANVHAPDGSLALPIATLLMMQLKAHEYLVATCVGQPVSPRLLKKVVRDSNGDSLRVTDCFDMDDWRPGTPQMKRCPVEKVAMSVKALQAVPRAYFGAESTIHSMRARGVILFSKAST
jgi:hypothetical protein